MSTSKEPITSGHRDPMGQFIPAHGSKPLTALAVTGPGPAAYIPQLGFTWCVSGPQYSILGKHPEPNAKPHPGPAEYKVTIGRCGPVKNTGFTLGRKGLTQINYNSEEKGTNSPGPAVTHATAISNSGSAGYTFGHPYKPKVSNTPSPAQYDAFEGMHHAFKFNSFIGHRADLTKAPKSLNPGPAAHDVNVNDKYRVKNTPPSHSMAGRLRIVDLNATTCSPGPGTYTLEAPEEAKYATLKGRSSIESKMDNPGPATYSLNNSCFSNVPKWSMTDRNTHEPLSGSPGANAYVPDDHMSIPNKISFTIRPKVEPCFPTVMNYPSKLKAPSPGPASYNSSKPFVDNDSASWSMTGRPREVMSQSPGPADYTIPEPKKATYSMGVKCESTDVCVKPMPGPGPGCYFPENMERGPKYSLGTSLKARKVPDTPGPNAYMLSTSMGKGSSSTLKSRPSPHIYSGFHKTF